MNRKEIADYREEKGEEKEENRVKIGAIIREKKEIRLEKKK